MHGSIRCMVESLVFEKKRVHSNMYAVQVLNVLAAKCFFELKAFKGPISGAFLVWQLVDTEHCVVVSID